TRKATTSAAKTRRASSRSELDFGLGFEAFCYGPSGGTKYPRVQATTQTKRGAPHRSAPFDISKCRALCLDRRGRVEPDDDRTAAGNAALVVGGCGRDARAGGGARDATDHGALGALADELSSDRAGNRADADLLRVLRLRLVADAVDRSGRHARVERVG